MVWVRLDDRFPEDPRIVGLSDAAFRLHVTALCYCGRNETDGKFTPKALPECKNVTLKELKRAGLWAAVGRGYMQIRSFLKYNPSSGLLRQQREQAAERMRRVRANKARTSQEPSSTPTRPRPRPRSSQKTENSTTRSSAAAAVLAVWNEHRAEQPEARRVGKRRPQLEALHREARGDLALIGKAVAAFAANRFMREGRYGLDTLLRHRTKWLDAAENGSPASGGSLADWVPPPGTGTETDD